MASVKEGFFVQKKFQVRKMGYYNGNEHFGCHTFFQPVRKHKDMSHEDKKTVNFSKLIKYMDSSTPLPRERAYERDQDVEKNLGLP